MDFSKKIWKTYEVVEDTLGLVPTREGKARSLAYEKGGKVKFTTMRTGDIMERACLEGGSSLEGRFTYVGKMLGIQYRRPIPVNEERNMYAFPLFGRKKVDNSWFFFSHISHAEKGKLDDSTFLVFLNGQRVQVNVSLHLMEQQILKTSRCKTMFESRHHRWQ